MHEFKFKRINPLQDRKKKVSSVKNTHLISENIIMM
jgi:hypothetical protein